MGKRSSRTDAILAAAPRGLPGGQRLVGGLTGDVGRRRPGDAAAASADAVASPAPALLIVEPERGSLVLSADGWMSWSPSAVGRWLSMRWIKLETCFPSYLFMRGQHSMIPGPFTTSALCSFTNLQ
jgi:hypothetical protein